jgi:hypothetical protein
MLSSNISSLQYIKHHTIKDYGEVRVYGPSSSAGGRSQGQVTWTLPSVAFVGLALSHAWTTEERIASLLLGLSLDVTNRSVAQSLNHTSNSQHFMEYRRSLPYSLEPKRAIWIQLISRHLVSLRSILILFSYICLVFFLPILHQNPARILTVTRTTCSANLILLDLIFFFYI